VPLAAATCLRTPAQPPALADCGRAALSSPRGLTSFPQYCIALHANVLPPPLLALLLLLLPPLLALVLLLVLVLVLLRGVTRWQNWNAFQMNFNASLVRQVASAMAANGLKDAGYTLLQAGGLGYTHCPVGNQTKGTWLADRNSTGFYQIDSARFPGPGSSAECLDDASLAVCLAKPNRCPEDCGCKNGNEGMRILATELKSQGYGWGTYSGLGGCTNAACEVPALNDSAYHGYIEQDFKLMIEEWGSDYIMLDAAGITSTPGSSWWRWCRLMQQEWADKIGNFSRPVILHNCHNYCSKKLCSHQFFLDLSPSCIASQHLRWSVRRHCSRYRLSRADPRSAPLQQDRRGTTVGGVGWVRGGGPPRCCLPPRW
jgi:hypothetical protein